MTPRKLPRMTMHDTMQDTMHVSPCAPKTPLMLPPHVKQLLEICGKPLSRQQLQDKSGIKDRKYFRKNYLNPALDAGLIERTIPEAPRSKFQKYRLTQAGKDYLQYKNKFG